MADKDNMALWNSVWQTDPANTKPVDDGRHKFTAIDAYAQIKRATEIWGPYGQAWKLDQIQLTYGQVPQLCGLSAVFIYPDGQFPIWNSIKHTANAYPSKTPGAAPTPGKVDADHVKKLITDTITKCLSLLGFNADIFMGMFEDSRYVESRNAECENAHRPGHAGDSHVTGGSEANPGVASKASLAQLHIDGIAACAGDKNGWNQWRPQVVAYATGGRVTSSAQMTQDEISKAIDYIAESNRVTKGAPAWNQQ